jgi:hypothetical protein
MGHPAESINTKDHWAVGFEWTVVGSKGDRYTVEMTNYGFECSCPAYRKCKHIKGVEQRFEDEEV